ncbi:hypothetical protein Pmani_024478 [Petrolisthes manimaculis]|uniref:Uncharacterized protein n=1 Tax=Petrolisthes manimaculis TaxID=1843537 RepID=A0AAE1P9N8_9EUCA|nr:hypothetical protein Pmani_024478 [Petrolisthes manimaculis]
MESSKHEVKNNRCMKFNPMSCKRDESIQGRTQKGVRKNIEEKGKERKMKIGVNGKRCLRDEGKESEKEETTNEE